MSVQPVFAPDAGTPPMGSSGRRRTGAIAALTGVALVFSTSLSFAAPPDGFAELVDKVKPAVVNIASTQKAEVAAERPGGGGQFQVPPGMRGTPFDEFLRRFFQAPGGGGGMGNDDESPAPGPGRSMALGSGFIIDPSGYIVTNNHVIANASKTQVTLPDGRKFDARVIGKDDKTDIALLKVDSDEKLPAVEWGDSDKARVGDWVIAVGNPFGLGGTVTAGILSARGRDIQAGPFDDYLQIDAPINRGNSGGPSFDRNGQVIGINTAIYSPNGGSIGIGFAIPASVAKPIVDQLRDKGRIDRGWLGVSIQPVTQEVADSLGMEDAHGALVAGVNASSPAAKAGLKQGDVIRAVNDHKLVEFRDLPRLIATAGPDKSVKLDVVRNGKEMPVQVALGRMPSDQTAKADDQSEGRGGKASPATNVLGLALAPLNKQVRARLELPDDAKGALVVEVKRDSPAADAGLAPGDIVVKVGDKNVTSPRDVTQSVQDASKAKRKAVLLLIQREGNERFVAVPLEKS